MPESLSCQSPQLLLCLLFSVWPDLWSQAAESQGLGLSEVVGEVVPREKGTSEWGRGWVKGQRREGNEMCVYGGGRVGLGWVERKFGLREGGAEDLFSSRLLAY